MFKFVILSVMLPLLVTSLLFSKYIFYNSVFNNKYKYPLVNYSISYAGFAFLFLTHEYFLISISYNSLGFVAYDYILGLTAFFWIEKRYGSLIIMATPVIVGFYLVFAHHVHILNILFSLIFAAIVLLLAIWVGGDKRKHRFIGFVILLTAVSIATPLVNAAIYDKPIENYFDLIYLVIGTLFVCGNLLLFNRQRSKTSTELAVLRQHEQYDTLTGLRSFFSFNQLMSSKSVDPTRCWTFVMVDIDHFKSINDEYGHLEGNKVLTFFANRLKQHFVDHVSAEYKIYRFGGEEFCAVMEDVLPDEAFMIINDFRTQLRKEHFTAEDGAPIQVSFSGGISSTQEFAGSIPDAVRHADEALYQAKKKGRSQIARYKVPELYGPIAENS
ncbi:MAG: GGDEF domain-containing protein [Oenococcus sp.]|uniref:GGDEF domain-containing protein n=1 Tax=Oenococcus sp. TaxID=1979414 RepID=UPI0039E93635